MLETIKVETGDNPYHILIGEGILLKHMLPEMQEMLMQRRWILITDKKVAALYPDLLNEFPGEMITQVVLPSGENSKSMEQATAVLENMAEAGITRQDGVLALGGGVVGDLAGFCASIYMRGVPWLQIPTTLLSQVDSSVGGKTGVNLKKGKNMAGSFYQPKAVWIDPLFLKTLPEVAFWGGCSEVVKYGIIEGACMRQWLTDHWSEIIQRDPALMARLIKRCLECKAAVVAADEREAGLRKILNFGHTAGHAIEKVLEYQITHGEALRQGMLLELELACRLHWVYRDHCNQLKAFVKKIPETTVIHDLNRSELAAAMTADKKNRDQRISFLLPREPGGIEEIQLSPDEVIRLLARSENLTD